MTLGRLILALLLACLALPATAAMPCHDDAAMPCHDDAAMPAMAHHAPASSDHRDQAVTAHTCIGCVPPSSWRRAPQMAVVPVVRIVADWAPAPLVLYGGSPPDTPPPRAA